MARFPAVCTHTGGHMKLLRILLAKLKAKRDYYIEQTFWAFFSTRRDYDDDYEE